MNWRSPSMARSASRKQCSERTFARGNILNKSRLFQRGISFRSQTIALLMPYLLGALLLILLPAGIAFYVAFTQSNESIHPSSLRAKFSTPESRSALLVAMINSLLFIMMGVPLRILGALGLALFYSRPRQPSGFIARLYTCRL